MNKDDPLFTIDALLSAPEIRISPIPHEIFQLAVQNVRDVVEGLV